jgi:WhiB family redox-sensing transcriptional regulator
MGRALKHHSEEESTTLSSKDDPFAFAIALFRPRGDTSWMERGACTNADPDLFFPHEGQSTAKAARKFCGGCPVAAECADFGVRNHEYGVWGGLTDKQRDQLRSRRRRSKAAAA